MKTEMISLLKMFAQSIGISVPLRKTKEQVERSPKFIGKREVVHMEQKQEKKTR